MTTKRNLTGTEKGIVIGMGTISVAVFMFVSLIIGLILLFMSIGICAIMEMNRK